MIEELFEIEKAAYNKSPVHLMDARVKILVFVAVIVAMVSVPYSPVVFTVAIAFLIFFTILWGISRLSPRIYLFRIAMAIPFGFLICGFQIFFTNRYYDQFTVVASLPLGINIYAQSIEFAIILLVKFLVCISFIVLLSSTTKLQDLLEGAGRLGMPPEFTLALGMMIRYLFVFGYIYRKTNESLQARCFDPFNRVLPYRYRITQLGYLIGTMFMRSYEQGERTFTSMLCRGYGRDSHIYIRKKSVRRGEWAFFFGSFAFITAVPLISWFYR